MRRAGARELLASRAIDCETMITHRMAISGAAGAPFRATLPSLGAVDVTQNLRSLPGAFRVTLVAICAAHVTRNLRCGTR
jgi:hypothetical protein